MATSRLDPSSLMFPFGPLCNREDVFVTDASAIRRNLDICRYLIMSRSEKDVFRWTQSFQSFRAGMQRDTMAAMAATVLLEHQHSDGSSVGRNPWVLPQHVHAMTASQDGRTMWPGPPEGSNIMGPAPHKMPASVHRWGVHANGWSGHPQRARGGYGHMQPDQHVGGGAGGSRGDGARVIGTRRPQRPSRRGEEPRGGQGSIPG